MAKIYAKRESYPYYRVAYYVAGRRVVRSFPTLAEAKKHARHTLREIRSGSEAPAIPARVARGVFWALEHLNELAKTLGWEKAPTIEEALIEFAEAKRMLGNGRLSEAVKAYVSTLQQVRRVSVKDAVEEFLTERERRTVPDAEGARPRLSPRVVYQDRLRLQRFAAAFVMDVVDLAKDHLDLFFRQHLREISAKSRNHYRGSLGVFIKWCIRKDYLPRNHALYESDGLCPDGKRKEPTDTGDIEIYSVGELEGLLSNAEGELRILIAIAAFAGLRTQECLRLDWADVWRRPRFVEVTRAKAKTRQHRMVPICAALTGWLSGYRQHKSGRIWATTEKHFHEKLRQVCQRANVPRKENALRHSFISYRLAHTQNENVVAMEAGTSPAMIHKHYRALVTPVEARKWFNVRPVKDSRQPRRAGRRELPATKQKVDSFDTHDNGHSSNLHRQNLGTATH